MPDGKGIRGIGAGLTNEDEWSGVGAAKEESSGVDAFRAVLRAAENVENLLGCADAYSERCAGVCEER